MKLKFILMAIMGLSITTTAEAQFLKKLKKKAEQAAERTVLNKTDEIVSEKTEETIDGVTEGGENNPDNQNTGNNGNAGGQTTSQGTPAMNPMMSKRTDTSKIPDIYEFDWEFKTEMVSTKGEKAQMNYFLNSSKKDYAGMEMSINEGNQQGTVKIVMDSNAEAMIMFMSANGQNMAQISKTPESKKKAKAEEFSYKEIGTKTILGYNCFGIEVENKATIATMYYTLDAPVSFSAFFNFAKNNAPKGFDPALVEVLKEEALLMEMHAVDKKKSDESYDLIPISLEKKATSIKKGDYQFMGF